MPCAFQAKRPRPFHKLNPGCQFHVGEDDLTKVDGESWCDFHLHMQTQDGHLTKKGEWTEQERANFNKRIFEWINQAEAEEKACDLTGVVFPDSVNFKREEPYPTMCFFKAQFCSNAIFKKVQFTGTTRFDEVQFASDARFDEAQFASDARFKNTQFSGYAWFEKTQFTGIAIFKKALFSGDISFARTRFSSYAWFENARFFSYVSFVEAEFSGDTTFAKVWFSSDTSFARARFLTDTSFAESRFSGDANFQKAQFSESIKFDSDGDSSTPEAIQANVFKHINFSDSTFDGPVSFINRQFRSTTSFFRCVFKKAPQFHNCTLHQGTNFDRTMFPSTFSDKAERAEAERAYRTLKLAMEQVRARQEESMFYALEQTCRQGRKDVDCTVRLASTLYLYCSDYGQSFKRPLAWLTGVTGVSWLLYALLGWSLNEEMFDFTLTQLVRPFNVWLSSNQSNLHTLFGQTKFVVKLIATCQSLFSLSLLALFFLAPRQNFKRG
ncbi:MAG: hypothetical protein GKS05_07480 [Nitrospirales bacterium]|nr:hypothetical protein [Nitrospirales bacterium]